MMRRRRRVPWDEEEEEERMDSERERGSEESLPRKEEDIAEVETERESDEW